MRPFGTVTNREAVIFEGAQPEEITPSKPLDNSQNAAQGVAPRGIAALNAMLGVDKDGKVE
jgi:hypothetical protein